MRLTLFHPHFWFAFFVASNGLAAPIKHFIRPSPNCSVREILDFIDPEAAIKRKLAKNAQALSSIDSGPAQNVEAAKVTGEIKRLAPHREPLLIGPRDPHMPDLKTHLQRTLTGQYKSVSKVSFNAEKEFLVNGLPLKPTSEYRFVIDNKYEMYMNTENHVTLANSEDKIKMAGTIWTDSKGRIMTITDATGTFQPKYDDLKKVLEYYFEKNGLQKLNPKRIIHRTHDEPGF